MDRNTVIGLSLIFLLMMAWSYLTMPTPEELQQRQAEQARVDSLAQLDALEPRGSGALVATDELDRTGSAAQGRSLTSGIFAAATVSDTLTASVRTPLVELTFTNVGGGPSSIRFLDYQTWDGQPVQLISDTTRSAYSLGFLSRESQNVESQNLLYRPLFNETEIVIGQGETRELSYELRLRDGSRLIQTYTVNGDDHQLQLDVRLEGVQNHILGNAVDFGWKPALNPTERDLTQDGMYASAYVYAGEELERFILTEAGRSENRINGTIDWVSTRTKFFTQIIRPSAASEAAMLTGEVNGDPKKPQTRHAYQSGVQLDISGASALRFGLYVGPLRYYDLREFEESTYEMIDLGAAWLRWFADPLVKWLIVPFFTYGSQFIGNYGILIILFALAVKLVLTPLTLQSFRSMAAMRELQPQMKELQERYKDNPQKLQEENLKLYRKNKVNPLGGCLPMLLQFPILITLWSYFQTSILIRQKPFLWADDLSAPDYILNFPIAIPFLGDQLAGFVVLMAASIILQTKVSGGMSTAPTTPGAPNMKIFMYIMPVMLLFFFNNFASGLSLYYLVFNVLSAGQQYWINRGAASGTPALAGAPGGSGSIGSGKSVRKGGAGSTGGTSSLKGGASKSSSKSNRRSSR